MKFKAMKAVESILIIPVKDVIKHIWVETMQYQPIVWFDLRVPDMMTSLPGSTGGPWHAVGPIDSRL